MISVIIPLYNKATVIERTIKSVFSQTYTDYEIVVVDDGSTDGSSDIIKKIDDSRIRLIKKVNGGVSSARNQGLSEARGKYIAFLDADDEWESEYLEKQHSLIKQFPQCEIYATNYKFVHINGKVENTILRGIDFTENNGILSDYFKIASMSHPPLWTSAIIVTKSALQSIGGFPEGITSGEDLLTWARLTCKYKIAFSKEVLAIYNLGEGYDFKNLPPRKQDDGDPVGNELKKLYRQYQNESLKLYISLWHKMRASVAIRYGLCSETIREGIKSLKYNIFNYKVIPIMILACLPHRIRTFIIRRAKQ